MAVPAPPMLTVLSRQGKGIQKGQNLSLNLAILLRQGFRTDSSERHYFSSLEPEQSPVKLVV